MKTKLLFIAKVLLVTFFAVVVLFSLIIIVGNSIMPAQLLPNQGTWYCEALQIQVCFDKNTDYYGTHIVLDGQKYRCGVGYDKGNPVFSIMYSNYSHDITTDEFLFEGECMYFDEEKMIVEEVDARTEYIFVRINDD